MKRFISNEELVRKFFVEALEEKHILRHLLVIASLIKTYGHKLDISERYIHLISKNNPEIAKLYQLLHTLGKTNSKDIKDIIKICKKTYAQYKKEFIIMADTHAQNMLIQHLHAQFKDAEITTNETAALGVDIKGE